MNKYSIELANGISYARPYINKFSDGFDTIEFVLDNDDSLDLCTFGVVYSLCGKTGMSIQGGGSLEKTTDDQSGKIILTWSLGTSISCDSGVVIYQVVAYSSNDDGTASAIWYSPQGRIVVGESVDTTEYETLQIGAEPSLVQQFMAAINKAQSDILAVNTMCNNNAKDILAVNTICNNNAKDILAVNTICNNNAKDILAVNTICNNNAKDILLLETEIADLSDGLNAATADIGAVADKVDKIKAAAVDLVYNPTSNNAQSGKAVAEAIASAKIGDGASIAVDHTYSPESNNAQSGKAVAEAIASVKIGDGASIAVDHTYSPESNNAQSGKAVAQGISDAANASKVYTDTKVAKVYEDADAIKKEWEQTYATKEYVANKVRLATFTLTEGEADVLVIPLEDDAFNYKSLAIRMYSPEQNMSRVLVRLYNTEKQTPISKIIDTVNTQYIAGNRADIKVEFFKTWCFSSLSGFVGTICNTPCYSVLFDVPYKSDVANALRFEGMKFIAGTQIKIEGAV